MKWLMDIFKEVWSAPTRAAARELAEQQAKALEREKEDYKVLAEDLERQVEQLESKVEQFQSELEALRPKSIELEEQTRAVLVYLFRNAGKVMECRSRIIAANFGLELSFAHIHLDRLREANLVVMRGTPDHAEWNITAAGRRYVVDNNLA